MTQQIHTRIWQEEAEPDNAFATRHARCHGYDIYGDLAGQAQWVEMLYLLFKGEAPNQAQTRLLNTLAVGLANPGPRDPSIHAAMCAGVGGSTAAAALMAALAVGAGQSGGAREVHSCILVWQHCATNLDAWEQQLRTPPAAASGIWPAAEHPPGFDAHGSSTAGIVADFLHTLANSYACDDSALAWLAQQRPALEQAAGHPLAISGVAAAALHTLGFDAAAAEMLYLLLRLPGAAAHALEQWQDYGHKKFPFFGIDLQDDPARSAV